MDDILLQVRMNRIEGYCDLEMWADARTELAELGTLVNRTPQSRELHLRVLMGTQAWIEAAELAMDLANEFSRQGGWFIYAAYCLHELGKTQEAREFLLAGPPSLKDEALFYYNMACYECVLGEIETAKLLLKQAVERDVNLQKVARQDADLVNLFLD